MLAEVSRKYNPTRAMGHCGKCLQLAVIILQIYVKRSWVALFQSKYTDFLKGTSFLIFGYHGLTQLSTYRISLITKATDQIFQPMVLFLHVTSWVVSGSLVRSPKVEWTVKVYSVFGIKSTSCTSFTDAPTRI